MGEQMRKLIAMLRLKVRQPQRDAWRGRQHRTRRERQTDRGDEQERDWKTQNRTTGYGQCSVADRQRARHITKQQGTRHVGGQSDCCRHHLYHFCCLPTLEDCIERKTSRQGSTSRAISTSRGDSARAGNGGTCSATYDPEWSPSPCLDIHAHTRAKQGRVPL